MEGERWRPVPVALYSDRYDVSSLGRVRSLFHRENIARCLLLKEVEQQSGYLTVTMSKNRCAKLVYIHALVLEAFGGPRPAGAQCSHLDGDRKNNQISNLSWMTPRENNQMKHLHGTAQSGEKNPRAKLTVDAVETIRHLIANGSSREDVAARFGVNKSHIHRIVHLQQWRA